jgi:hypothetical protein
MVYVLFFVILRANNVHNNLTIVYTVEVNMYSNIKVENALNMILLKLLIN